MSDLLGIGASGVRAYQSALSAVGSNVSNADTPGYTRRSVTLQENTSTNASQLGYINNDQFGGVLTADVTRAWDDYQAAAARTAGGEAGSADTRQTWLSNAETALNDSATGVGQSATAFFNAGDALAADAGSTGNRKAFLGALDQTASAFRQTAGALATVSTGIATAAQTTVQTVNADLDALDKVNAQLRNQAQGSSQQADLMDQRDRLLDDISGNVGINVSVADNGVATVTIASSGLQLTGGVDGNGSGARFAIATGNNGALSLQAFSSGKSQAVGDAGGTLGGFVTSASVVADRRNSLDQMATSFAAAVNAWQAQGTDGTGNAGAPLLGGTSASTLQITTSDPAAVAAASGGASNGNLLTLSSLRGQSGLEQTWDGMVTDQGQMVSAVNSESTAADSAKESAFGARDANTGVDLNTEAAEMIRYQQAYNGAAKVIQVAKDTLQSILDLF
jgi:flagellar hook-associated protein 1 FlgK